MKENEEQRNIKTTRRKKKCSNDIRIERLNKQNKKIGVYNSEK